MIASVSDSSEQGRRLILEPNNSLPWQGNWGFLISLLVLGILVSSAFVMAGAWLVLPLLILQLLALLAMCYQASLLASCKEVVSINEEHVVVEKGRLRAEQIWRFERNKARILIEDTGEPFENFRVSLVGDAGMLCLAENLDVEDCANLRSLLTESGLRVVTSSHWVVLEA